MYVFNKTGFSKLLPKLLETKVYVGSSAGSMVMGKRFATEVYKSLYGQEATFGAGGSFLELIDGAIMPHLDSPYFPNRRETLMKAAKNQSLLALWPAAFKV